MRKSYTALLAIEIKQLRDPFIDAKRSIIKCAISDITKNNVGYCKELKSVIHELRNT
jgi:hypothetical protein